MLSHPTLLRQLRRLGIAEGAPPEAAAWAAFLQAVEGVYRHADEDRYTMERSLELSSAEMRDLYERLSAQETERRVTAEGRLDALVRAVPGAVFRFELADARISFVSEGILALAGRPASEFVNADRTTIAGWFHPEDVVRITERVVRVNTGAASLQAEARLLAPDGTMRWVELRAATRFDREGLPVALEGLVLDHQQAHAAAEALRAARELAEANTRAKSEFLANVSHELRTPLNAVVGLSGLLLERPLPPESKELAALLHQSGEGLLALIGDVLDFSKIEARRVELELAEFDLEELFDECVAAFAHDAARRGLAFGLTTAAELPVRVRGDRTRLRQVLDNLVGNALKFTEHGRVTIDARPVPFDAGFRLRCAVIDTGIGVAEAARDRLFVPFTQADTTSTRRFGGTGLGLAIARQLTDLMGGTVGMRSEEGVGSEFWFEVPLGVVRSCAPPPFSGLRLLLIEPDEARGDLLASRLEAWGAHVLRVREAASALGVLRDPRIGAPLDVVVVGLGGGSQPALAALIGPRGARRGVVLSSVGSPAGSIPEGYVTLGMPAKGPALRAAIIGKPGAATAPRRVDLSPSRLRVLVAEDNPVNQRVIRLQLGQFGVEPSVAGDGEAAVRAYAAGTFDLVLMDCQMPVMDGPEASRRIRELERESGRRVRIVALTAHAQEEERQRCVEAGMDDFVTKPMRLEQLGVLLAALAQPGSE